MFSAWCPLAHIREKTQYTHYVQQKQNKTVIALTILDDWHKYYLQWNILPIFLEHKKRKLWILFSHFLYTFKIKKLTKTFQIIYNTFG